MATTKTTTSSSAKAMENKQKKIAAAGSIEASVYNQKGASVGTIALPSNVFGVAWNNDLVHQVVVSMLSNARAGTAHTKDRGEVRGGGKKPWKQKGTGRARHGSSRSPIWVGGGVTHGPKSDKDYTKKINKKMRAKALFAILSKKFADNAILFVDALTLDAAKTKDAAATLAALAKVKGFERLTTKKRTGVLLAVPTLSAALAKSFRNLPGVTLITTSELNALDAMRFAHVVIVDGAHASELLAAKMK